MAQGKSQSASAANPSTGGGGPSSSSTPAANGSGLQGLSFPKGIWDSKLTQSPRPTDYGLKSERDIVFVCYVLAPTENASAPFVLYNSPLDGTPENPSPFVSAWLPQSHYLQGALVTLPHRKGHYFEASGEGDSGGSEPRATDAGGFVKEESGLSWKDMGEMSSKGKHECTDVNSGHPLLMNQLLVVAIDMAYIPEEIQMRFTVLNFNVTSQQVAPINVTPIQPSIAAGTATQAGPGAFAARKPPKKPLRAHQIYYLSWPSLISGDTIIAINVNLVYTPVAPALSWEPHTFYPAGSIVMSAGLRAGAPPAAANTIGHYYLALNSGISSDVLPDTSPFDTAVANVKTFSEGSGLEWMEFGLTPPAIAPIAWAPRVTYGTGDFVIPPSPTSNTPKAENRANGHYYQALTHAQSDVKPPSFSDSGETTSDGQHLTWTDMGTKLPVPPPSEWMASHRYNTGDLVIPPHAISNNHYYRAKATGGVSGATPPQFSADRTMFDDGTNLSWIDMGPLTLNPAPAPWSANTAFSIGAQITPNPPNGHYYQATRSGVTGPNAPAFPLSGNRVAETDKLVWTDSGTTLPTGVKLKRWVADTPFMVGDTIQDQTTAHYYTVIQAGTSGDTSPVFLVPTPAIANEHDGTIAWQDLGTSLPASVSTGQPQPSDQTVSAINYSFPQAHQLSYFTLTAGVALSSIQTRSFVNTSSASASSPSWTTVKNGPIIDPILALTAYIKPVDAERTWRLRWKDLTPGPTIAFSLSSPANNFYFGGSSALLNRNIQILYGLSIARVSVLEPASQQASATTAATQSQIAKGGFIGLSFNILGFIQSLPGL